MASIENDNEHETVIVEGEIWAVMTTPDADSGLSESVEDVSRNEAEENLTTPLAEPDSAQTVAPGNKSTIKAIGLPCWRGLRDSRRSRSYSAS